MSVKNYGFSSDIEPEWHVEEGGYILDGTILWEVVPLEENAPVWQPTTKYFLGMVVNTDYIPAGSHVYGSDLIYGNSEVYYKVAPQFPRIVHYIKKSYRVARVGEDPFNGLPGSETSDAHGSLYYFPEAYRSEEIFQVVSELIDHVRFKYHKMLMYELQGKIDPFSAFFDQDYTYSIFNSNKVIKEMPNELSKKGHYLLTDLFKSKGSGQAIEYIAKLYDLKIECYNYDEFRSLIKKDADIKYNDIVIVLRGTKIPTPEEELRILNIIKQLVYVKMNPRFYYIIVFDDKFRIDSAMYNSIGKTFHDVIPRPDSHDYGEGFRYGEGYKYSQQIFTPFGSDIINAELENIVDTLPGFESQLKIFYPNNWSDLFSVDSSVFFRYLKGIEDISVIDSELKQIMTMNFNDRAEIDSLVETSIRKVSEELMKFASRVAVEVDNNIVDIATIKSEVKEKLEITFSDIIGLYSLLNITNMTAFEDSGLDMESFLRESVILKPEEIVPFQSEISYKFYESHKDKLSELISTHFVSELEIFNDMITPVNSILNSFVMTKYIEDIIEFKSRMNSRLDITFYDVSKYYSHLTIAETEEFKDVINTVSNISKVVLVTTMSSAFEMPENYYYGDGYRYKDKDLYYNKKLFTPFRSNMYNRRIK